jgi:predicted nucleic acid-binding protein
MFLLDTNVVSELRRRKRADASVLAWADALDPAELFVSAVTILELERGALLLGRRDPPQAEILYRWIRSDILPSFAARILPVDEMVALRCAPLHVPDPKPERDALIAATALEHRLTLVTRNVRDFAPMGVPLLNPWEQP